MFVIVVVAYPGNPSMRVLELENMSTLTLNFNRVEDVKKRQLQARLRYTCMAENQLGRIQNSFELKVGRLPDSPEIMRMEYKDGKIRVDLVRPSATNLSSPSPCRPNRVGPERESRRAAGGQLPSGGR